MSLPSVLCFEVLIWTDKIFLLSSITGAFGKISSILLKSEGSRPTSEQNVGDTKESKQQNKHVEGFYEEYSFLKEEPVQSFVTVSVRNSLEEDKTFVRFDTDLPGDVVVHWGVCRDGTKRWEVPPAPHPPKTRVFRNKALQTLLKVQVDKILFFFKRRTFLCLGK